MEPWELGLDYVIEAFKSVLGLKEVSPLGSPKRTGVCDSKEKPVQWHTGYWMGLGKFEFGIVLECKKYEYWPIAVFIENELKNSTLLSKLQDIAKSEDGAKIWVGFARNAWQGKARPVIERIGVIVHRIAEDVEIAPIGERGGKAQPIAGCVLIN